MESRSTGHQISEFVDRLLPGSRVIWIANGALGTVQPDRSILWDDGHHMTRKQMNDSHALLIHSEAERTALQDALTRRLNCVQRGCTLLSWDAATCVERLTEHLCPLAIISESESPSLIGRRKRRFKGARPAQAS